MRILKFNDLSIRFSYKKNIFMSRSHRCVNKVILKFIDYKYLQWYPLL